MRNAKLLLMPVAAALLVACGGGNDDASMSSTPTPPVATTPAPAPTPTAFNTYAIQLALQQDAASETKPPLSIEDQEFSFSDDASVFVALVPFN